MTPAEFEIIQRYIDAGKVCGTCGNKVRFQTGVSAFRCSIHGLTLCETSKASNCWWLQMSKTSCVFWCGVTLDKESN
jgi:hypothetical protein